MPPKPDPTSGDSSNQPPPVPPPPVRPPPQEPVTTPPNSGNQTPVGTGDPDEVAYMRRLEILTDLQRRLRNNIRITNASFESGRPPLRPTEDMRGDVTNMYDRPTTDFLWEMKPVKVSNNMATSEDIVKIKVALEGMGVPTEYVKLVIIKMCVLCASNSSSSYQDPNGTIEWPGGAIMVDDVVGVVNSISTLRRVCRLYAPVTWNYMHIHNCPPSDWAAMGFSYEVRYAAFDVFDYVENEAAVRPGAGVMPRPTKAEYIAYNAQKKIALNRANNNNTYASFDAEVTGGRMGPTIEHNWNNANNRRQ